MPAGADPAAGQSSAVSQTYYPANVAHAGRVASRTENGTQTFYRYSDHGEVSHVWGHTYPLRYVYDSSGRLENLYTYRSLALATPTTEPDWNGGDATTWAYYPGTAALAVKTSAGGDKITYTYDAEGRLFSQQYENEVTVGSSILYGYDLQGRVKSIEYMGVSTPGVSFESPDALGRYTVITDGAGTRTLTHGPRGLVTSESVTGTPMGDFVLTRTEGAWGRVEGVSLSIGGNQVASTTYGYDAVTGRMNSVGNGDFTAEYAYNANSDQVQTTTFKHNTSSVLSSTSTLNGLNRLHRIESTATSTQMVLNRHTYGYDARHRRTTVEEADQRKWHYGYNDRNEVTSGVKKLANGTPVLVHSFGYEFDPIGNRNTATANGRQSVYTPNEENQIEN